MFSFTNSVVLLVILILLYSFLHFKDFSLIFVKSKKDDSFHLVRNLPDRKEAANHMAEIKSRLLKLVKYLTEKYPEDPRTQRLNERFDIDSIQETRIDSSHTSFSVDKGEEIHLCLRDKSDNFNLHDINTLMFVALHEISHVASVNKGHDDEFKTNFVWILEHAAQIGIFKNVDYARNNVKFCGEIINSNPLISKMRIIKS
jgi:hypothetical protein